MSIPDTAVTFLVENIAHILTYNYNLVAGVRDNIVELQTELKHLGALMEDFVEKDSGSRYLKSLVREIRTTIDDAEDAVDSYLVQATVQKSKDWVSKAFHILDYPKKLREIGKKIQQIRDKVNKIRQDSAFQALQFQANARLGQPSKSKEDPKVEEEHVVGFEGAFDYVSHLLTGRSTKLEVVSIVGMLGLGKTTLAKKVFNHCDVDFQYMIRVFVYVSAEYERKEVFLRILNSFTKVDEKVNQMREDELESHLRKNLEGKQYLIVLDDIWEKKDWDRLKDAFPKNNQRCRVLITTRSKIVAEHAKNTLNSSTSVYELDFLPLEKSRELLRWKVFRDDEFPDNLKTYEEHIARKCDGLPLAIVVIAGIIFNSRENVDCWKQISEGVEDYIARDQNETTKVIELMYKHLPNRLKLCFMYLGLFPEDYEIPVWKLVRLWVAEGLIKNEGRLNLENIAEEYLEELVHRNVVIVGQRRSNDKIKTCNLHDTLREFCKKEAAQENLFKEIKKENFHSLLHGRLSLDEDRRLCFNNVNVSDLISRKPSGKCVRSLLTFTREETNVEAPNVSAIPKTFKLLRVLEIQSLKFQRYPIDLNHLILLKYIAISSKFTTLPKSMSALWSLQTLIVNTDSPVLKIEADIWKFSQFRHLHTNSSTILPPFDTKPPRKKENVLIDQDIRTLSTIAPESCTKEILERSKKLKKLGIRGKLAELFTGSAESCLFSNLKDLTSLENLRLVNETASELDCLPFETSSFPQQITKLTLVGTHLGWQEMHKLGRLENLEILKVKEHAFEGKKWKTEPRGFLKLKHLHIGTTDLEEWEASARDFPRLKYLEVSHCSELKAIPGDFAEIPTLLSVSLHCTNSAVALSASKLQEKRDNSNKKFKVSVYPPDHLKNEPEA